MKQKLFILFFFVLIVALLIGLNAASYVQKPKTLDSELSPNRSTFNPGATGTQALYSLLAETGKKVVRWQDSPGALLTAKKDVPAVFVVTGTLRRSFTEPETADLLRWVSNGGRLVLIDREPPEGLAVTTAGWKLVSKYTFKGELYRIDPTDQKEMAGNVTAVKPVQPTIFTQSVNAIQPSLFAGSIEFERINDSSKSAMRIDRFQAAPPPVAERTLPPVDDDDDQGNDAPPPPKPVSGSGQGSGIGTGTTRVAAEPPSDSAPVVHFASAGNNLVVDAPYGEGRIVFLSDPYMVSNGGINLADNAQLALNLVSAGEFVVAFDEYHQGYGNDSNKFIQFFEGTPVVAIFLQGLILVGLVFFSQSQRFARPVPEPEADRLSKLEYVAAMAELQSRTKAFDLAVENIYNDFRRRACRLFGLDNFTAKTSDLAAMIAERTGLDASKTGSDLFTCEEIIRGEPTNKREVLGLISSLRVIEERLGMTRAGRTRI